MASTFFQDFNQNTPVVSAWLNDVNKAVYSPGGVTKNALQSAAAWARFSIAGGVVTIQQSSNILSVVRQSTGVYLITYAAALTAATNCYSIVTNTSGFVEYSAETTSSVTVTVNNTLNVPTDPGSVSVLIFGAD